MTSYSYDGSVWSEPTAISDTAGIDDDDSAEVTPAIAFNESAGVFVLSTLYQVDGQNAVRTYASEDGTSDWVELFPDWAGSGPDSAFRNIATSLDMDCGGSDVQAHVCTMVYARRSYLQRDVRFRDFGVYNDSVNGITASIGTTAFVGGWPDTYHAPSVLVGDNSGPGTIPPVWVATHDIDPESTAAAGVWSAERREGASPYSVSVDWTATTPNPDAGSLAEGAVALARGLVNGQEQRVIYRSFAG